MGVTTKAKKGMGGEGKNLRRKQWVARKMSGDKVEELHCRKFLLVALRRAKVARMIKKCEALWLQMFSDSRITGHIFFYNPPCRKTTQHLV